jgi:type VI secretion system protein ImpA
MPAIDFQALTAPVEPDDPCGPDLDLAADSAYLNFLAGAEGRLPSSYFDGKDESGALGRPFQVSKIELDGIVAAATPLLAKTRDLRLLVLLAKYSMLGREFEQFRTLIRAIAALLNDQWEGVHPRSEDGEFQARLVAVESIDVQPTVIMPLQFLPLIEHRRFGTVTYRSHLIATGAIAPREGEDVIDLSTIEKITRETGVPALVAKRSEFSELGVALNAITRTWSDKDSSGPSVQLDKVVDVVNKIVAFLDEAATRLDPSSGLVPPKADNAEDLSAEDGADGAAAAGKSVAAGRVTTSAEAAAALNAVADYFARNEPSSPTLLLVRQANQLLGKSFIEVMRTLVPTHVEQAAINIGRAETFNLPIERLSSFAGDGAGAEATNGAGDQAAETPQFDIQSRAQALALLDQVGAYFRAAEPSSPIPFLIERARDLAQRDFLSVLKALLPADTLKPNNS